MNTFSAENQITFTHNTTNPFKAASLRSTAHYMGIQYKTQNLCGVYRVTIQCDTQHEYNLLTKEAG